MDLALVGSWRDFKSAVVPRDLVDEQKGRHDVIIGMRGEGKVLVPLYPSRRTRKLGVDFRVMIFDVRTNDISHHVCHTRIGHAAKIGIGDLDRRIHSPECGLLWGVVGLKIEAWPAVDSLTIGLLMRLALLDPIAEVVAQGGQE